MPVTNEIYKCWREIKKKVKWENKGKHPRLPKRPCWNLGFRKQAKNTQITQAEKKRTNIQENVMIQPLEMFLAKGYQRNSN